MNRRTWLLNNPISKELLIEEYVNKKLSAREIANKIGRSESNVYKAMRKHKIPRRIAGGMGGSKRRDLAGKKFGYLTAIERLEEINNHSIYKCQCDCGNYKQVRASHLLANNITTCGSCGIRNDNYEHIEIASTVFTKIKNEARRMNREFNLTLEYLWELYIQQNRKCALSDMLITFGSSIKDKTQTASLDRIDSSKGYIEGNVQWVFKKINMMKRDYSQECFIELCKLVAEKNK